MKLRLKLKHSVKASHGRGRRGDTLWHFDPVFFSVRFQISTDNNNNYNNNNKQDLFSAQNQGHPLALSALQ